MQNIHIFGLVILIISSGTVTAFGTLESSTSHRGWLYVGGTGQGNYTSIQNAIDNASPSDTIYVFNGIYRENVILNKDNITLIGEDKEKTVIDAMNNSGLDAFFASRGHITISGFTFQNAARYGLYILSYDDYNVVKNNIFKNNYQIGLIIYCNDGNLISGNSFISNSHIGFELSESKYSSITNNNFSSNNIGLSLYCWAFYISVNNNIFNSNNLGLEIYASMCNRIYHNDFISNQINANDDSHNFWDNGSQGNYWSNYTGPDNNNDGIGDLPYAIPDRDNQDNYPLMHPFENYINLNVSLSSLTVIEMTEFGITVKTMLGRPLQDAQIEFNGQTEQTDATGKVYFVAPKVDADTTYELVASKEGFKNASCSITVKNNPAKLSLIFGRITNLSTTGDYISFNAVKTRIVSLPPFNFNTYVSGEKIFLDKDYKGFIDVRFLFVIEKE